MLKNLQIGDTFPDVSLPDENGRVHRLSTLQGDDVMVLMLGRGEHCPRERQHQREMLRFPAAALHQAGVVNRGPAEARQHCTLVIDEW